MSKKINWKWGNVMEVANVFGNQGVENITFELTDDSVIFLSDGWYLTSFSY